MFPRAELSILGDMESRFSQALRAGDDLDQLEVEEFLMLDADRLNEGGVPGPSIVWAAGGGFY